MIIVPGTDLETSKKAVEIAEKFPGVYAAVGIHPHHVCQYRSSAKQFFHTRTSPQKRGFSKVKRIAFASDLISLLSKMLSHPKVVAVGEVGVDRHEYKKTIYQTYQVDQAFIELQKLFFIEQIKLAYKYKKAVIIHNRQAIDELLAILNTKYLILNTKMVFHCCEPDDRLLNFAIKNHVYIGVDGDVTYRKDKQEFIKKVPMDLLVLETDSPFLTPRLSSPRPQGRYNEPKNIKVIAEFIAKLLNCQIAELMEKTTENAKRLFKI